MAETNPTCVPDDDVPAATRIPTNPTHTTQTRKESTPNPPNPHAAHENYLGPISATPAKMVSVMLKLANVSSASVVFDLGCNDGRVLIAAAVEYGARGVGVEIDQGACAKAARLIRDAKVEDLVTIRESDAKLVNDLSDATVCFVYLLPTGNKKISKKVMKDLTGGTLVMTYVFRLPKEQWDPYLETVEAVDSTRDRGTNKGVDTSSFNKVFKYRVPDTKPGWCVVPD